MGKDLQRDLGLYAVLTISIGAMIGSGIFVLPGLASKIAGPAVVLAYALAGLVVLPAALSKAEMATAMPDAGGTYLYIDRAMGPLMGTIAGAGAWFSLVFKSAFALVGLGAYLVLFVPAAEAFTVPVALGLAVLLVGVNVVGVKQTGTLQAVIVSTVLLVLALFVLDGMTYVDASRYHPGFFAKGLGGVLKATGFVFVSYAGVTKIASVAEEVEDPGTNIPLGMILSVVLMMGVYTLVTFVTIGVTDPATITHSLTPMADAADAILGPFMGTAGKLVLAGTAVLALTSMANAGILASSRYPFAMSRDRLAPPALESVSGRFRTPVASITLTGAAVLVLIAFVPVVELAKLASAFQILVFVFINVALVAFRASNPDWYDPEFRSPAYPWVQVAGVLGGLVLVAFLGTLPLLGAAGMVGAGLVFYFAYGRSRVRREGVGVDAVRREQKTRALEETRAVMEAEDLTVLVPVAPRIPRDREEGLIRLAQDVVEARGGTVRLIAFEEVPDQMPLGIERERRTAAEEAFEERSHAIADGRGLPIEVGEVVSHDLTRALGNYVVGEDVDLVLADAAHLPGGGLGGSDVLGWLTREAPCEVILLDHGDVPASIDNVAVTSDGGPFDAEKVRTADALAARNGADLRFVHLVGEDAPETQLDSALAYHGELADLVTVEAESRVVRGRTDPARIREALEGADVVVAEAAEYAPRDPGIRESARLVSNAVGVPVLLVYPRGRRRRSWWRRLGDRILYR